MDTASGPFAYATNHVSYLTVAGNKDLMYWYAIKRSHPRTELAAQGSWQRPSSLYYNARSPGSALPSRVRSIEDMLRHVCLELGRREAQPHISRLYFWYTACMLFAKPSISTQ